jgi:hypothetical protein
MNRVRLLTAWKGAGTRTDKHRPAVADDHPLGPGESWSDVTGQPVASLLPAPNVHTVELVCTDASLAALQADSNYAPGILWSEPT